MKLADEITSYIAFAVMIGGLAVLAAFFVVGTVLLVLFLLGG